MTGKTFAEMTPAGRKAAVRRALDQLQAELAAGAEQISAIMDSAETEPEPLPDNIALAFQQGHQDAMADAQACRMIEGSPAHWRSRAHTVPDRPDERDAWMRGYGRQFAYWGGDKGDGNS